MTTPWPTHSPIPYVRVTLRMPGGKRKTIWAKKLASSSAALVKYVEVKEDGGDYSREGAGGTTIDEIRLYVATPADIVRERPARMNLTYAWLEEVEP